MNFFIKKIWQGDIDETVHKKFTRFGKGIFTKRAIISLSRNNKIKLCSSFELVEDILLFCFNIAKKAKVAGVVLAKQEINMPGLVQKKKTKNLIEYYLEGEINEEKIKELSKKAYFLLLDIFENDIKLKTKKRLPKPSRSGKEKIDDKFCQLEANIKFWPQFKEEFFFDVAEFKKARASHTFEINALVLPADKKDFEQLRLEAKRKGKIIRELEIDTKKEYHEKNFIA